MTRRPWQRVRVTHGSGNVFADAGLPDAEERQVKADLARHIRAIIGERDLTQSQAAELLGVDQPKISALMRGLLTGFSLERLMRFVTALDRSVEVVLMPPQSGSVAARVTVDTLAGFLERATDDLWSALYRDFPNVHGIQTQTVVDTVAASDVPSAFGGIFHSEPMNFYPLSSQLITTDDIFVAGTLGIGSMGKTVSGGFSSLWNSVAFTGGTCGDWTQQRHVIGAPSGSTVEKALDKSVNDDRAPLDLLRVAA